MPVRCAIHATCASTLAELFHLLICAFGINVVRTRGGPVVKPRYNFVPVSAAVPLPLEKSHQHAVRANEACLLFSFADFQPADVAADGSRVQLGLSFSNRVPASERASERWQARQRGWLQSLRRARQPVSCPLACSPPTPYTVHKSKQAGKGRPPAALCVNVADAPAAASRIEEEADSDGVTEVGNSFRTREALPELTSVLLRHHSTILTVKEFRLRSIRGIGRGGGVRAAQKCDRRAANDVARDSRETLQLVALARRDMKGN